MSWRREGSSGRLISRPTARSSRGSGAHQHVRIAIRFARVRRDRHSTLSLRSLCRSRQTPPPPPPPWSASRRLSAVSLICMAAISPVAALDRHFASSRTSPLRSLSRLTAAATSAVDLVHGGRHRRRCGSRPALSPASTMVIAATRDVYRAPPSPRSSAPPHMWRSPAIAIADSPLHASAATTVLVYVRRGRCHRMRPPQPPRWSASATRPLSSLSHVYAWSLHRRCRLRPPLSSIVAVTTAVVVT